MATDPNAKWIFVCDQLNTHKPESLVRWVVEKLGLGLSDVELGAKGKGGILKTLEAFGVWNDAEVALWFTRDNQKSTGLRSVGNFY